MFKPGHKTNQALVYALLYAQGIIPRYTLDPIPATTRSVPTLTLKRVAPKRRAGAPKAVTRRSPGGEDSEAEEIRLVAPRRPCPSY